MPKFMFAYHGGGEMPASEEERAEMMKAWQDWYASMGEALVDGGAPVGKSLTVSAEGVTNNGGSNPLSGYTIVQADTPEAAAEFAGRCPMLKSGGTVEVAPIVEMDM